MASTLDKTYFFNDFSVCWGDTNFFPSNRLNRLIQKIKSCRATRKLYEKALQTPTGDARVRGNWAIRFVPEPHWPAFCSIYSRTIVIDRKTDEEQTFAYLIFELINASRSFQFSFIYEKLYAGLFADANQYAEAIELCEHETVMEYNRIMTEVSEEQKERRINPWSSSIIDRYRNFPMDPKSAWEQVKNTAHAENYRKDWEKSKGTLPKLVHVLPKPNPTSRSLSGRIGDFIENIDLEIYELIHKIFRACVKVFIFCVRSLSPFLSQNRQIRLGHWIEKIEIDTISEKELFSAARTALKQGDMKRAQQLITRVEALQLLRHDRTGLAKRVAYIASQSEKAIDLKQEIDRAHTDLEAVVNRLCKDGLPLAEAEKHPEVIQALKVKIEAQILLKRELIALIDQQLSG